MVTDVAPNVKGVGMVTVPVNVGDALVNNVPDVGSVNVVDPVVVNNSVLAAVPVDSGNMYLVAAGVK